MKQLRILTGRHAGVQLDLTSTRYVIGADDEADIQISDWQAEPATLQADNDVISIRIAATDTDATATEAAAQRFEDFVARRFADVVLCVGPADQPWPSSVELLARLMQPAVQAVKAKARSSTMLWGALVALVTTTVVGTAAARLGQRSAAAVAEGGVAASRPATVESLRAEVERAIGTTAIEGLAVTVQGEGVVVQGLVNSPADAAALRQRLAALPHAERIVHAYASATDVAQSIVEALAQPELQVVHQGHGVFIVSGQAANLERTRGAAARIAGDLAPLVRRIEVSAAGTMAADRTPLSAVLSSDGLQYVQTRDGAKHLSLLPPPAVPDAAAPPADPIH